MWRQPTSPTTAVVDPTSPQPSHTPLGCGSAVTCHLMQFRSFSHFEDMPKHSRWIANPAQSLHLAPSPCRHSSTVDGRSLSTGSLSHHGGVRGVYFGDLPH